MGVQLTDQELWDFVRAAHTGILTTLDKEGFPISLPTWHVVENRRVYIRTLDASAKSRRSSATPGCASWSRAASSGSI